ncbi:hypothetical protein BpHYR1_019436 [Brachionus plicatilis]|uniref:Uncharacterized protein n=1 Tax=Brachionus plicatilis TaxID=10195 RepID=A0A3M7PE36_BRAPC|nr:hypothetical protein BpHYR1_019436 [Brachionus plicatilis]
MNQWQIEKLLVMSCQFNEMNLPNQLYYFSILARMTDLIQRIFKISLNINYILTIVEKLRSEMQK